MHSSGLHALDLHRHVVCCSSTGGSKAAMATMGMMVTSFTRRVLERSMARSGAPGTPWGQACTWAGRRSSSRELIPPPDTSSSSSSTDRQHDRHTSSSSWRPRPGQHVGGGADDVGTHAVAVAVCVCVLQEERHQAADRLQACECGAAVPDCGLAQVRSRHSAVSQQLGNKGWWTFVSTTPCQLPGCLLELLAHVDCTAALACCSQGWLV